jgi:hypothetical protein
MDSAAVPEFQPWKSERIEQLSLPLPEVVANEENWEIVAIANESINVAFEERCRVRRSVSLIRP